ncbi:MAG: cytochrome c [Burkholderiaceae bacterium]
MRINSLAAFAVLGLVITLPVAAQFRNAEAAVEYRQSAFTVMSNHFGRIGAMVKGDTPYNAAAATASADIVVVMSKLPYEAFPEGTSGTKKGSPKPNVWTERAKFDDLAKKMQGEVVKLAAATRTNNLDAIKPAFAEAGKACKACHDDFRNP